jgi:nicotinate phosphoribosyltransferase
MSPAPPWVELGDLALFTDLYELTMLQAYVAEGLDEPATFSLFVRRLPGRRNYLLACGLADALALLEQLRFDDKAIAFLESTGLFTRRFLQWLEGFRFACDVRAVAEGTPLFADEPLLEVTGELPQAQLVESLVMNQLHLQTVIASKASRLVQAAAGRPLVDFGLRRAHGIDAGLKAARAGYIAGVDATSNVLAGRLYGMPIAGTMAHSYIQAHHDEQEAFAEFARVNPETVLLVDTFDTLDGVRHVIELAHRLGSDFRVRAVRLDSGDLAALARQARRLLDEAGLQRVRIFASGGLEEDAIATLVTAGAPIDAFGVGTQLTNSDDAPSLDMAYKLVEYAGVGRRKTSPGKATLPGRKQVHRLLRDGVACQDVLGLADEEADGLPLLDPVMRQGRTLAPPVALASLRERCARAVGELPPALRQLARAPTPYPVVLSRALREQGSL